MSSILKIKENGQFKSVPALKGEPGKDGTQISFTREYVAGDDVVKIATITCDGVDTALYAPTSGGGGSQVTYTDICTFVGRINVGKITINGTEHFVQIPSNVSEFANDSGYITEDDIPTKTSDLTNDSNFTSESEIILALANTAFRSGFKPFTLAMHYVKGDIVAQPFSLYLNEVYNGLVFYRCKADCTNKELSNTTYWEEYNYVSNIINEINTIKSNMPTSYSETVLWENTDTLSSTYTFAGQTITLSDSIDNYDYVEVFLNNGAAYYDYLLSPIKIDEEHSKGRGFVVAKYGFSRMFSASGSSITFENCTYRATYASSTETTDNRVMCPIKVVGVKL